MGHNFFDGPGGPYVGAHLRLRCQSVRADGDPPNSTNPQTRKFFWKQGSVNLKPLKATVHTSQAQRPVPDVGARMRLDQGPSLDVVTIDLDACL